MSRVRRITARAGAAMATVALIAFVSLATATQAQAAPSGCWSKIVTWQTEGHAYCSSGTGTYNVFITCKNPFGFWAYRESAWQRPGGGFVARATCPAGYVGQSAGVGLRN
jgi:hypothetical protein